MNTSTRLNKRTPCTLRADCIKLARTGMVDLIEIINYSEKGMGLISKEDFEIGSNLIIRVHDKPLIKDHLARRNIRTVGVVEVRWISAIGNNNGSEFRAGVKYLFYP